MAVPKSSHPRTGVTLMDEDEHKTYFGSVAKYRFNQQANLISQKNLILGDGSTLEAVLSKSPAVLKKRRDEAKAEARALSQQKHFGLNSLGHGQGHKTDGLLVGSRSAPFLPLICNLGERVPISKSTSPTLDEMAASTTRRLPSLLPRDATSNPNVKDGFAMKSSDSAFSGSKMLMSDEKHLKSVSCKVGGSSDEHSLLRGDSFELDNDSDLDDKELLEISDTRDFSLTPRSRFIATCLRERLNPRAALVVRQNFSTSLQLGHMGMGDRMAVILADSLRELPNIQSIDIADNNLTDVGLAPLMRALTQIPGLLQLNTSQNEIGLETAAAMAEYLSRVDCPLEQLILNAADVDDYECERFVKSLAHNSVLRELSLCNNRIGQAETLNTVMPDLTTGGESIAALLRSPLCRLEKLHLAWNCIRLNSAVDLCSSLAVNNCLTYLDLSFNGLGTDGGEALGDAIIDNKRLRTLLLNSNGLKSRACFTICVGIIENFTLTNVSLDGNPIGKQGAQALMSVPMNAGNRVNVSSVGCNIDISDDTCWFNHLSPCRTYTLNLSNHFERAVAFAVLQLGACHQTFVLAEASLNGQVVELEQRYSTEREQYFTDEQRDVIASLRKIKEVSQNKALVNELFHAADTEHEDNISPEMFVRLLGDLGLQLDSKTADEVVREVDIDGSGEISLDEVQFFLMGHYDKINAQLIDLTEFPVMALKGPAGCSVQRFVPPDQGTIVLKLENRIVQKDICKTMSSFDNACISKVAHESGNTSSMLSHALVSTKIRLTEALSLFDSMYKDTGKRFKALASLLPQMVEVKEARALITAVTKNDKNQIGQLKVEIGAAIRPLCGFPDGFYSLDMTLESSRLCFTRLLEISQTQEHHVAVKSPLGYRKFGNTAQSGNWTSFRNERFNSEPIVVSTEAFDVIPKKGRLEFDFVSSHRESLRDKPISDNRLLRTLQMCHLLTDVNQVAKEKDFLRSQKHFCDAMLSGVTSGAHQRSKADALEMSLEQTRFYSSLDERSSCLEKAAKNELVLIDIYAVDRVQTAPHAKGKGNKGNQKGGKGNHKPSSSSASRAGTADPPASRGHNGDDPSLPPLLNSSMPLVVSPSTVATSPPSVDDSDLLVDRDAGATAGVLNVSNLNKQMQAVVREFSLLIPHPHVSDLSKSARLCEFLEENLNTEWIMARHLALIMRLFSIGSVDKTPFGSYRVELIVQLFNRVLDQHNFEIVLATLTPREIACLHCRIGYLKLFNPCKPDGWYQLDLSIWEERQITKMLVGLAIKEDVKNWEDASFTWKREEPPMPGWILNETWMNDEGVPRSGFLDIKYNTDIGRRAQSVSPNIPFRKSLCCLVMIDEVNLVTDEEKIRTSLDAVTHEAMHTPHHSRPVSAAAHKSKEVVSEPEGISYLKSNTALFENYLCKKDPVPV